MRQALALVLDEDRDRIERPAGLAVDIGRHGVRLALVVAATAHRQPPRSSLMRAISAPSSGGLTKQSPAPCRMPPALSVSITFVLLSSTWLFPFGPSRASSRAARTAVSPAKTTPPRTKPRKPT